MRPSLDYTKLRNEIPFDKTMPVRPYWNVEADSYPIHWQSNIEIIQPVENIYTVTVESTQLILQPGDFLLIAPGTLHSIRAPETGSRYILQFLPQLFTHIEGLEKLPSLFSPYVFFSQQAAGEICGQLRAVTDRIYEAYYRQESFYGAAIYASILELILTLLRCRDTFPGGLGNSHFTITDKYNDKFINICDYIQLHCAEQLTLAQMASQSGFSQSHFLRLFKEYTGMSFNAYINHCRISCAERLLAIHPELTIMEVSMRSGFGSIATFNRLFKQVTGYTPTLYREKLPEKRRELL